jgi:hypothetical protein
MICEDCGVVALTIAEFHKTVGTAMFWGGVIICISGIVVSGMGQLVGYLRRRKQPDISDKQILRLYRTWEHERTKL